MASERPAPPPLVVLDANLLYPFQLRNLLVQLGADAVIAPRWTTRINAAWVGHLVAAGRAPRDRLRRTLELMNDAVPEAEISGWEGRMAGLTLPDPDDRHVLAAFLAAGAGTIRTMNRQDVPPAALAPHGVVALHPDGLLCGLYDAGPALVRAAMAAAPASRSCTAPSLRDDLDMVARQGLPHLTRRRRIAVFSRATRACLFRGFPWGLSANVRLSDRPGRTGKRLPRVRERCPNRTDHSWHGRTR